MHRAVMLSGALLLAACGSAEPSREELQEQVDELSVSLSDARALIEQRDAQLEEARSKVSALSTASSDLQSQVARFDNEDWRDVVDEARSASDTVQEATGEAEEAVAEE